MSKGRLLPEQAEAWAIGWKRKSREPIWQKADGRYGLDRTRRQGERWELARTPWLRQILEDCRREDVREVVLMAGSQCAKTAPMLITLAWHVAHDPCAMAWLTGNKDMAGEAYEERIKPTLLRCPDCEPVLLTDRLHMTKDAIRTKTCTIIIDGSQSEGALNQNPYRIVFADEVGNEDLWPEGALEKLAKRMRSFEDAKRFLFSRPGKKDAPFHKRYLDGTQCEWVWPCLGCGEEIALVWSKDHCHITTGLRNKSELRYEGNACWMQCQCGYKHYPTPQIQRHIIENGKWAHQNENPKTGVVSYHWNALLPPWVRWADLVDEWHKAIEQRRRGNVAPLRIFVTETLGEPWEEREVEADPKALEDRRGEYTAGDAWPDVLTKADGSAARFIAADVQQDVIYWRCRLFGKDGESRGHEWGRCFTFAELDGVAQRLGVAKYFVGVDSGYRTQEVYRACAAYGWKAMKGEDRQEFIVDEPGLGRVRRCWNRSQADPHAGTAQAGRVIVPLYLFADDAMQDMLALHMAGKAGRWSYERDAGSDYVAQMLSEEKRADPKTGKVEWHRIRRANHLRDCEKMVLVLAIASGVLRA
jgi:phage terminase large subunit GpA-like protein